MAFATSFARRCCTLSSFHLPTIPFPVGQAFGNRPFRALPMRSESMHRVLGVVLAIGWGTAVLSAQTAEELVAKNLQAKGGLEKIKAIKSFKYSGKFQQGSFTAQVAAEAKAPDDLREMFTIQGM